MEKYRFENLITLFLQGLYEFTGGSLHCRLGFKILSYNRKKLVAHYLHKWHQR